jgi:hypothetical protein
VSERGQATVELVAVLPVLLLVALALCQLLAVGYGAVLAGNAAEAGALALAGGGDPAVAARAALPGGAEARAGVHVGGGRVTVALRPPTLVPALAERLELSSTAVIAR